MECPNQVTYIIKDGDSFYTIANHFRTTVPSIIALNPNTDPYNLQIGSEIIVCPGEGFVGNESQNLPEIDFDKQLCLAKGMQAAWLQHCYWIRKLLVSLADNLKDTDLVENRLLQNPYDIAQIYSAYYNPDVAQLVAQVITEHIQICHAIMLAMRENNTVVANNLIRQLYIQSDKMANALRMICPYYDFEKLCQMLKEHIDLTLELITLRLAGNFQEDIEVFNKIESGIMQISDYLSSGIIQQFPQNF